MNRALTSGLALLFAAALPACADPPLLYGDHLASQPGETAAPKPDMAVKPYPSEPYGNQMGETLESFQVDGYPLSVKVDNSQAKWTTGLEPLRDFFQSGTCKAIVVSFGASWCGACQEEQAALPADVKADPGFCVVNILQEGPVNGSGKVTREDVDNWVMQYNQNFPVVLGTKTTQNLWNGYGPTIGLPFNLIVEPKGMTVKDVIQGFDPKIHDKAIAACAM